MKMPANILIIFLASAFVSIEASEITDRLHLIEEEIKYLRNENQHLKIENRNLQVRIEMLERSKAIIEPVPFNTTIGELEVRVERLEEDMFQAQADIINNQGSINSLEFSLQETIETVMDHTDDLNLIEQNIMNLDVNTDDLQNRTSDLEQDVLNIESNLEEISVRASNLEEINSDTKNSAFFAILNSNIIFETQYQIIPFDNVDINEGGHYNATTGTYTAPQSGIYQFYWYIRASPQGNSWLYIDGNGYVNPMEDYIEGWHGDGSSVTIALEAGQTVDVRTGNQPYTVNGGRTSWFGGHLLFPEL